MTSGHFRRKCFLAIEMQLLMSDKVSVSSHTLEEISPSVRHCLQAVYTCTSQQACSGIANIYRFLSKYCRPATSREAATVPTVPAIAAALGPRGDLKRAPARKPAEEASHLCTRVVPQRSLQHGIMHVQHSANAAALQRRSGPLL